MSLTLPAVTGPHTSVNCTLRLLSSRIRTESTVGAGYAEASTGDDPRFSYSYGQVESVCTSRGISDAGMFQLDFRDERLLPFEGAGAISRWRIELPPETNRFDLRSLSDVILHVQYTAREGGGVLGQAARAEALKTALPVALRFMSIKSELKPAWTKFEEELGPEGDDYPQVLSLALDKKVPFVPGVGPTLLTKIWLAFDIDHADAGTIEVPMTLTPQASPANPVSLGDARWKVVELDYDPGQDLSTTELELSITQTDLSTSPLSTYTEAHPLDAEKLRLKPSIFRDVMLIVRIERDPPV